nr:thiamine phosphate synthase [Enterovibrio coralii]
MKPSLSFARMEGGIGPLYPVVDDVALLKRLLAFGVKTVQLRVKDPEHPQLDAMIQEAVNCGKLCGAQVFINDHWQKALAAGAYGIHLGQDDLKTADLAAIANAGIRLGVSTRTADELDLAWLFILAMSRLVIFFRHLPSRCLRHHKAWRSSPST